MSRALDLANLGIGKVSPNPLVGCVIVQNNRIIGEGWHRKFGEPHAEVNAIQSVVDKDLLSSSIIYVNLEPCSHHGKTPPCTDLIIRSKVKRVVISTADTNSSVTGGGIEIMERQGIEVTENILYDQGRDLNRRFFTNKEKRRPYVILKWAETSDGFIARKDYSSKWISTAESRKLVHKWRSEEDAILVGRTTAEKDNPGLDVRDWSGENPVRVVFDPNLRLKKNLHIMDQRTNTIVYNYEKEDHSDNIILVKIEKNDAFLKSVMEDLLSRNIGSIIVEGGSKTIQSFIDMELWDEARVFKSKSKFKKGIKAPALNARIFASEQIAEDTLDIYRNLQSDV